MASALFDIDPLFESINSSTLLLTPNRRLAANLQSAYAETCSKRGLLVWEQPDILPFDDWVQLCWQQLINNDSYLSRNTTRLQPIQETLLWERIIRDDEKCLLLKPYATAKQAQSAWRTLQLWQCEINRDFYFHPDSNRFAHWAEQFQAHCQKQSLLNASAQMESLLEAFEIGELNPVKQIQLIGFQHLPPLHEQLIQSAGDAWEMYRPIESAAINYQLACDDAVQELTLAAQWARQQLEINSEQRIAIIVPDLAQQRGAIETALTKAFEPQYWLPSTPRYQLPFNISAGVPLTNTPLISSALGILELLRREFDYQTLYAMLKCPFINVDETGDFDSGTELELFLRRGGWPVFDLTLLIDLVNNNPRLNSRYASFIAALQAVRELQAQNEQHIDGPKHWRVVFDTLLQTFNWPATARRLDSVEYQQFNRWKLVLDEFSNFSSVDSSICGKLGLEEALNLLNRLALAADFQAQTPQTPIQVLGILEGGGLQFDAVWLLGLNDHLWPATANPTPFIPARLQQELNMPHASPERELSFSRELLKAYQQSSPVVIASYALHSDDQQLRASTLINDFESTTAETLGLDIGSSFHPYYEASNEAPHLDQFEDSSGPNLDIDAELVAGGSAILKDQAACPFRAFVTHRLIARELTEPDYHLNAAQRGTLIHRALEQLWNTLGNSSTLLASDDQKLKETILQAVRVALRPLITQRSDLFGDCYTKTEIDRLSLLLGQWLEVEKSRAPFEVEAIEKALLVNLKGLPLRVRIDRIDRLDDGSCMLIDYKTGVCNTSKWQGERLEEPQLPLYSICMAGADDEAGNSIQALSFARISVEQQGFVGISAQEGSAPGVYSIEKSRGWNPELSWPDINDQWQQTLESLAGDFIRGDAIVDPAKSNTCQYCHLHSLCRIHQIEEQENGAR